VVAQQLVIPEAEYQRDLEMIRHPGQWPAWPKLPLSHPVQREPSCPFLGQLGFLLDQSGPPYIVFLGCMFEVDPATAPTIRFETIEALLEAGWRVD
jgi:hypothetical protein